MRNRRKNNRKKINKICRYSMRASRLLLPLSKDVNRELVFASLSLEERQTVPQALDLSSRLRFHSAFLPEVTSVNPKSIELSVRSGASARFNEVLSIALPFRYPYTLKKKRIPRRHRHKECCLLLPANNSDNEWLSRLQSAIDKRMNIRVHSINNLILIVAAILNRLNRCEKTILCCILLTCFLYAKLDFFILLRFNKNADKIVALLFAQSLRKT